MNELFFHQMNTNKQENKGSQKTSEQQSTAVTNSEQDRDGGSGFH